MNLVRQLVTETNQDGMYSRFGHLAVNYWGVTAGGAVLSS